MRSFLCNELEPLSYLILALALLLQLKHYRLVRYKVLCTYYTLCALLIYFGIVWLDPNTWNYNLIFYANTVILSWYYRKLFISTAKQRLTVVCTAFSTLIFVYVNIIQLQYNEYNYSIYGISFIIIILYALLYLHQLLINLKEESLLLNFDFWLTCGYLLYFLGSFFIILYYDHFKTLSKRGDMWQIHNIILFICSAITLLVSIQIYKKNKLPND